MGYRELLTLIIILGSTGALLCFCHRSRVSLGLPRAKSRGEREFDIDSKQETRLKRVLKYLRAKAKPAKASRGSGKGVTITNEEYRKMVKVSEAQATRDFDVLERKGLVRQAGRTGRSVKYKLK